MWNRQLEIKQAVEILEKTNDGRDLYQSEENIERHGKNGDGWQLAIIQCAVNGHLNESGHVLFAALHRQVLLGDYLYPIDEFKSRFCPEL